MTIVVDASVALRWYFQNGPDRAEDLLHQHDHFIAPDLVIAEITNAVWKIRDIFLSTNCFANLHRWRKHRAKTLQVGCVDSAQSSYILEFLSAFMIFGGY